MWDNLAFDLIMANAEQPLWGWADSDAISLLEYWADFNEEMFFILTYDKPDIILKNLLKEIDNDELDQSLIEKKLKDWIDYNQTLISFYRKYKHRCLLVNGEQVMESAQEYIHSVAQTAQIEILQGNIELPATQNQSLFKNSQTLDFLVREVLADNEEVQGVFTQLQSLANMPLNLQHKTKSMLDLLKETINIQKELDNTYQELEDSKQQVVRSSEEWQKS